MSTPTDRACRTCGRIGVANGARGECKTCYQWRRSHRGQARPERPPTRADRPAGAFTTSEVVKVSRLTMRQVDYATRTGRVPPSLHGAQGSGSTRWWSAADLADLTYIKDRLDWGMTLEAACRCDDPPFPSRPIPAVLMDRVSA